MQYNSLSGVEVIGFTLDFSDEFSLTVGGSVRDALYGEGKLGL